MKNDSIALLTLEAPNNVSDEDLKLRQMLVSSFRILPKELFISLRHLQPQVGCLNVCGFCSQEAIGGVWQLTPVALRNLFSAMKTVALEVAGEYMSAEGRPYMPRFSLSENGLLNAEFRMPNSGLVAYGRISHRPGVIYPYLDNDIASYPYLLEYLKYSKADLGVKVRLSTVGYSRHNKQLQDMHEAINKECLDALGGVRLSMTTYTLGWTKHAERSGLTSRDEFVMDLANFLRTYRPAVNHLGTGDRAASAEFKFPPLVETADVEDDMIAGRHVIHAGPYLLISRTIFEKTPFFACARIRSNERHSIFIDAVPKVYMTVVSEELRNSDWRNVAKKIISGNGENLSKVLFKYIFKQSRLYLFENEEGVYYGLDPEMTEHGFAAKQFYPMTGKRSVSGYIDSERYFLNVLTKFKLTNGISRRDLFPDASWGNVDRVISMLKDRADLYKSIDPAVTAHITENISPLVEGYRKALEMAGYSAAYFFDKGFTVDTGEICNLGRVYSEYKGLASRRDSVVTPQHERVYGFNSSLVHEGTTWRISVSPTSGTSIRAAGKRSVATPVASLLVEEFSLSRLASPEGEVSRRWFIPLRSEDIEHIDSSRQKIDFLIPGRVG